MRDALGVLTITFMAGMTILGVRLTVSNPKLTLTVCAIGTLALLFIGLRYPFSRRFVEGREKKPESVQGEKI
ncbi:MAG: hypothetical protein AAB594_02085 [Patescibacteria group bacterium]